MKTFDTPRKSPLYTPVRTEMSHAFFASLWAVPDKRFKGLDRTSTASDGMLTAMLDIDNHGLIR